MFASITAAHSPLIRNYAAPPSPGTTPSIVGTPVPATDGVAFAVTALPSLYGTTGTLIPLTTLATVDCTDDSMVIALSEPVPGLTFTYSAKTLKVSGTPTTPTGVHRVVVTYITTSNTIRGSSSHTITIVAAAEVLTIGAMAGASGRVGTPLAATLAAPSANFPVDVVALQSGAIPGLAATLTWAKTSSAGSGSLALTGTPTQAGAYSLSASYYGNGTLLGTSTHSVNIAAAYEAPAAAPAPTPAPPPPSPTPPPPAAPAPQPGSAPDPLQSTVRVLMHFDAATGLTTDQKGNTWRNLGCTSTTGAVKQGAQIGGATVPGGAFMDSSVSDLDGAAGALTAECMVNISQAGWNALTAIGSDVRYMPVLSLLDNAKGTLWTMGYGSWVISDGAGNFPRIVVACAWNKLNSLENVGGTRSNSVAITDRRFTSWPGRFMHMATCRKVHFGATTGQAMWLDGYGGLYPTGFIDASKYETATQSANAAQSLQIGGSIPAVEYLLENARQVSMLPFDGVIDELRIGVNSRYSGYFNYTNVFSIDATARVIPWPNT